ncbi:MAG: beta-propeller domain-containing protein [Candidatus Hydrogenedentes bacterium]|nr:beta-propeller domain-containing protein [Candidatus Hydrogenedentota bacterium]
MKHAVSILVTLTLAGSLAGCPWFPFIPVTPHEFLSADTGNRNFGALPGTVDDATGAEGEESPGGDSASREVVEPDVVRRVGNTLYILNQHRGLLIVDLDSLTLVGQAPTYGYPRDLYVDGDRAYVIVGQVQDFAVLDAAAVYSAQSRLYTVDISEPAHPSVQGEFEIEGDLVDSRLVGEVLYAVSASYNWYNGGGVAEKQQGAESWITSVNLADPGNAAVVDTLKFSGYGTVIHATSTGLYVAAPDWETNTTQITSIDISDAGGAMATGGSATVPGHVADRFKMDVFEGVLRVASNTSWPQRDVYVSTIGVTDPFALVPLGQTLIENAAGETLFATRFDGDRAYLVTFLRIDPLFVIDLSDPAAPLVAGELEVPGFSTHIEPRGDRLIALGVDDTAGGNRVKVSLYDVADPANPLELDTASFGESWSWSSAYDDVKAFTVLDDRLLVPVSGWDPLTYQSFERLQLIDYDNDSLTVRGYASLQGRALRSLEYGDRLYAVTPEQVVRLDASNPDAPVETGALTLAEYLVDYLELPLGAGVEVVSNFSQQQTLVRTVDANGTPLDEVAVEGENFVSAHVAGDRIAVVHNGWDEKGFYRVAIIDASDPAALDVRANLRVDVDPFWGGYWYYYDIGLGGAVPVAEDALVAYPWWGGAAQDNAVVAGNTLVLRCTSQQYDAVIGEETPAQGLALIDLESAAWSATLGLGYDQVNTVAAVDGTVYLGTKETAGQDILGRGICAHYVHELDLAARSVAREANVPGTWVQYDPAGEVLVLDDYQYDGLSGLSRTLHTVSWTDAGVTPLDSLDLASSYGSVTAAGTSIYVDSYENGYSLRRIGVAGNGTLSVGASLPLGNVWSYVIGARDETVFLVLGGRAIANYDFSGEPVANYTEPVMSSPLRLRFGAEAAHAPLGYSGRVILPY